MLIDLYGLIIDCKTGCPSLQAQLIRPFDLYLAEQGEPGVLVTIIESDPPYDEFPDVEASFSTPRNVVYDTDKFKIVDYFGNGAIVEDKAKSEFTIYGQDHNFLQESFYLLIISIFGQYCDKNGMLRIHALAISYADKAILLPIPPGGGKSTMAFSMLQEEGFRLISDDEPIVSQSGAILPFALRIGTLDSRKIEGIPEEFVYTIDRMEFGLKYFIDVRYWETQLERRELSNIVYVASRRKINGPPSIRKIPKRKILRSLLRDAVIGVGLYQGLEFMLSHSVWSSVRQIGTALKRATVAWKLLRNVETYELTLSRDIQKNRQVLSEFVRNLP